MKYKIGDEVELVLTDDVASKHIDEVIRNTSHAFVGVITDKCSQAKQPYLVKLHNPIKYGGLYDDHLWFTEQRLRLVIKKKQLNLEIIL